MVKAVKRTENKLFAILVYVYIAACPLRTPFNIDSTNLIQIPSAIYDCATIAMD